MDFRGSHINDTRGGTRDEQFVARLESRSFYLELCHTNLGEIFASLAHIDFPFGGIGTIVAVPFAERLPLIISVPETTVEDTCQFGIPMVLLLFRESSVEHTLDGFLIGFHHGIDIFRTTGTTFNLKDTHTALHHAIDETHGLQVLRTHDVFIIDFQLGTRLRIGDDIGTAANLHTSAAVGRTSRIIQTHIALARNGHAQSTMTKHLDAYQIPAGTFHLLFHQLTVDFRHLVHIQFTGQYHHISKLCIELQRLNV